MPNNDVEFSVEDLKAKLKTQFAVDTLKRAVDHALGSLSPQTEAEGVFLQTLSTVLTGIVID